MEIWKDIKGYEGLYQISNYGNVRSLKKWAGNKHLSKWIDSIKQLKPFDNGNGYLIISLRKNTIRKNFYIHRLVAQHFMKPQIGKNIVNHKDFNKHNNHVNNLEYCSQKDNVLYSKDHMCHMKKFNNKLNTQYIRKKGNKYELTLRKKYIGTYKTLNDAIIARNNIIKGDDYYDGFNFAK